MKVEKLKKEFKPITITLKTEKEYLDLYYILTDWYLNEKRRPPISGAIVFAKNLLDEFDIQIGED